MARNFGFTKTPARPDAALGRMAQGWGDMNERHSRATRRDRLYRALAIALIAIIAGILLAAIASHSWAQALDIASRAPALMRF